jgi:PAS domain S-box-containing protein
MSKTVTSVGPDAHLLRDLIDGVDAVIYEVDRSGWTRFVNRRAVELFGYPKERWLSQPNFAQAIAHTGDRAKVRAHFYRCLRYAQDRKLEYRVVSADGETIWVQEMLAPSQDQSGEVHSLRGVIWRIEKPAKAEHEQLAALRTELAAERERSDQLADMLQLQELCQRLWDSLELLPLLERVLAATASLHGTDMGIVRIYDPERSDLEIVASLGMSQQYLDRYRRVPVGDVASGLAIVQGQPFIVEDLDDDEAAAARLVEPARIGGYRAKYSTFMTTRRSELLGTIATCFRKHHRPTERECALAALFARQAADFVENARRIQRFQDADRRKEMAVAALVHEVRNPLHVILNAIRGLKESAANSSDQRELCELITRQASLMSRLAEELAEAARPGTSRTLLDQQPVDLAKAMARSIESVIPAVHERGHCISSVPPGEPISVMADPVRMEQILVNLLTNAAQHTEPGGQITLDAWRENENVAMRVRDDGVGIAPESLSRVFEPYFRGDASKARGEGLGLGLALVKLFAERQGGSVSAHSDGPGKGSEFVVRLPAVR